MFWPFTLIYVYVLAAKGQSCNPDIDLNLIICNMNYFIMVAFIYVNHDVIIFTMHIHVYVGGKWSSCFDDKVEFLNISYCHIQKFRFLKIYRRKPTADYTLRSRDGKRSEE